MTQDSNSIAFLFVHLGKNPAITLNTSARFAKFYCPESEVFLITDNPEAHLDFPGKLISYSTEQRDSRFAKYVRKHRELENISGGYWLYTVERLFALMWATQSFGSETTIVHLESDVLSFLESDDIRRMKNEYETAAVPKIGDFLGVASILFFKTKTQLDLAIGNLLSLFLANKKSLNDMQLLGIGLSKNILAELPSIPNVQPTIYDGAAIGQYFFGLDPIHNMNKQISGYQNPDYPITLSTCKFEMLGEKESLYIIHNSSRYRVPILHNHAKRILGLPFEDIESWRQLVAEANGETSRQENPIFTLNIHAQKTRIQDRIRRYLRKKKII